MKRTKTITEKRWGFKLGPDLYTYRGRKENAKAYARGISGTPVAVFRVTLTYEVPRDTR